MCGEETLVVFECGGGIGWVLLAAKDWSIYQSPWTSSLRSHDWRSILVFMFAVGFVPGLSWRGSGAIGGEIGGCEDAIALRELGFGVAFRRSPEVIEGQGGCFGPACPRERLWYHVL